MTDPRFLDTLIERLAGSPASTALDGIHAALRRCEMASPDPAASYNAVRTAVCELVPSAAAGDAVVQVDVFRPAELRLSQSIRAQVLAGIEAANRLTPPAPLERLEEFRKAFRERFEDRQVPLLERATSRKL